MYRPMFPALMDAGDPLPRSLHSSPEVLVRLSIASGRICSRRPGAPWPSAAPTLWPPRALHCFAACLGVILFGLGMKFNQSVILGRAETCFIAAVKGLDIPSRKAADLGLDLAPRKHRATLRAQMAVT